MTLSARNASPLSDRHDDGDLRHGPLSLGLQHEHNPKANIPQIPQLLRSTHNQSVNEEGFEVARRILEPALARQPLAEERARTWTSKSA